MRALLLASLLVLTCLVPVGGATHDSGTTVLDSGAPVTGRFEFNQTAARPPAQLEGVLVLESRDQRVMVNGSVIVMDDTTARLENPPSLERETVVRIDEELEPFSEHRVPFLVSIHGIGDIQVLFEPDPQAKHRLRVDSVEVAGVAPALVSLDSPDLEAQLVSVPGRPAELTVTLTALPESELTDLRLTASEASEDVKIGDLAAGESRTVTLTVEADVGQRYRGVDRSAILPKLSGMEGGETFSHPLYQTNGGLFEAIHPSVYIATESAVFVVPPQDVHLDEPTTFDVVVLNAGTSPIGASGRVELTLPGMPHLDASFPVDELVGAGQVETLTLDWTPPAAGLWQVTVRHNLDKREARVEQIHVSGPLAGADFQVSAQFLKRGTSATVSVVLTASQAVDVDGLRLTMPRAPLEGMISINDLFSVEPVQGASLKPDSPVTLELNLTPKATGQYHLYLVVETPEGPSIHDVGTLTVTGSMGGWFVAWSPTLLVGGLVGMHMVWRRRWVT